MFSVKGIAYEAVGNVWTSGTCPYITNGLSGQN